jgi:hypothetical protein
MLSVIEERGAVPFAPFRYERVHMLGFFQQDGLPAKWKHWQPTVDAMLSGVDAPGPIYLMIDQAKVPAGRTHRRRRSRRWALDAGDGPS